MAGPDTMTPQMPPGPPLSRLRWRLPLIAAFIAIDIAALGLLPLPERLVLALRSAIAPGLGLLPDHAWLAGALFIATFASTWAWFRWGAAVPVLATWWIGIVLTLRFAPGDDHSHAVTAAAIESPALVRAVHEFTWMMAVYVLVYWAGMLVRRFPPVDRLIASRERKRPAGASALLHLPSRDRARAIVLWELARTIGGAAPGRQFLAEALAPPSRERRLRLVALAGHGTWRDPLRNDNASLRAALLLTGGDDRDVAAEAARARLGMPASEPGWVGLLDGTLLAAALARNDPVAGQRWAYALERWFRLQRGHRPEARHDFAGIARGRAPGWHHAAAMALAAASGWADPAREWEALRPQVLAAVGRGGRRTEDNRMVAAGRCWAALMSDDTAARLLGRVTSSARDPIAQALDTLAGALKSNPQALRSTVAITNSGREAPAITASPRPVQGPSPT